MTSQLEKAQKIWKEIRDSSQQYPYEKRILCKNLISIKAQQHKETCQDWLEYLQVQMADFKNVNGTCFRIMNYKEKDLQATIKFWEEKGI